MLTKFLDFIVDFYTTIFLLITILFTFFLVKVFRYSLTESFILAFLVFNVGVRGLIAFWANTYPPLAREIAQKYHWPNDCSLQREVAASEGAFGLLGILSIWFHGHFWLATIIGYSFCWFISESASIIKVIKRYLINGEKRANLAIFIGMCLDLVFAILIVVAYLYYTFM